MLFIPIILDLWVCRCGSVGDTGGDFEVKSKYLVRPREKQNETKQICFTSEHIPKGGRSVRFLIAYKNDTCSSNLMTSHLHLSNDNEYILF